VAQCNYDKVFGSDFIRVVSCNTTGLCRTLKAIDKTYGIKQAHATLIRRAADPWDIYHGPINALVPHLVVPSHHGPDVRTIIPGLEIFTTSISVPTTLMHMHSISVDLNAKPDVEDVANLFRETTRVRMVYNSDGIRSTAEILEYAKDLGRERGDMPEVCVWKETIGVQNNKLFYLQAIHQESDVVPENIDAIRAAMNSCGQQESITKTNKSLDIA
jgi:glyceraldehyde-3-phosphate dehydrogenase (NAD(P))